MSSPTETRRLPAWAGASNAAHAQPTGRLVQSSREISQQKQSDSSQPCEDVSEQVSSPKAADVVSKAANRGTKAAGQEFSKLLEGVIFTVSGLVNPERSEVRKMALDMGAQYRPTWSDDSTLLVCPSPNTPTFKQVKASGGTIVHKDWIAKCYQQKELVAVEIYLLHVGRPWRTGSNVDDSTDFGVANDLTVLDNLNVGQNHSAVKGHNAESQTNLSLKKHGKAGGAGMNQTAVVLKNLASPVDVQQWVLEDLAATLTWLEQQSDKPEEKELETVAAQGLLVCLDDAIRSLEEDKGLSMVMDNWAFIPRAVKELAVYEKGGHCIKEQLISEGERFKVIYESQLKKLGFGVPVVHGGVPGGAKTGNGKNHAAVESLRPDPCGEIEKDVDDDATEIISDTDSRDPADFDSDDTEELTENEIAHCKEKILQTFRLD